MDGLHHRVHREKSEGTENGGRCAFGTMKPRRSEGLRSAIRRGTRREQRDSSI